MSDTSEQTAFPFPTSSAEASPAKTSRSRGRARVSTGSGRGFGSSSPESWLTFDLASSSWRTSPLSDDEVSESFSGTWPRAGTMRRGTACPQPPSAPLTRGTGSSWSRGEYPTPSATPYGTSQNEGSVEHDRPATKGTPSLSTWAAAGGPTAEPKGPAWPTPTHADHDRGGDYPRGNPTLPKAAKTWPTPTARNDTGASETETRQGSPDLQTSAKKWATPQAHDHRGGAGTNSPFASLARDARQWPTPTSGDEARSGSRVGSSSTKAHPGTSLTDATCRDGLPDRPICPHGDACPGVLNPRFVLWLMGFPRTWFAPHFERPETLSLFPSER